ncbi:hypothetical protein NXV13_22275 [Bacteroides ovatus]|nr:hypothetical protein [Bacteroides ovatus]
MAKLKPDYIEWVLTLNASDAQKEIHNLSEKNKELRDSNKEIKKAMTDLIATGKAGGKQWKRLDEQLKENNKTLGENNKKIAECEKRLDKTTMSANQLARKANALRKELRDTVKSLQPEKYAALEKELKEVEKAYGRNCTKKAEGFGGSLLSLNKIKTVLVRCVCHYRRNDNRTDCRRAKGCDQYYYRVREEKQYFVPLFWEPRKRVSRI